MSLHERLKHARTRAGFTLDQVSERTSIGQSSISEFEHKRREPSLSQIRRLAQAYGRSVDFFLSDAPMPREIVLWREKPAENGPEIEAKFLRYCQQYHNLERWNDEVEASSLPFESGRSPEHYSYKDARRLAQDVHRILRLGEYPGQSLLRILEEVRGVKIFHLDFAPTGTAASTYSNEIGSAVLLNSANKRWRRNFDLAHELFHLLTWNVFRLETQDSDVVPSEFEEKLANAFASELLMPSAAVGYELDRISKDGNVRVEDLFDVARVFDVSVEALIWRMKTLRLIKEDEQARQLIERAKSMSRIYEDRTDDTPAAFPTRYRSLAIKTLRRGEISLGKFAQYVEMSRREARDYLSYEVEDSDELQIAST